MHTAKKSTPLLTRRQFLRVGLAGGAVLLTARLVYGPFARMRLAEVPEAEQLKTLNPRTATALAAIAPVMLGSAFPPAEPEETRLGAQHALVRAIDAAIAAMPTPVQAEISQLLDLLIFPPTRRLLVGLREEWARADQDDIRGFLYRWRESRFQLLRAGYQGLHQLVCAGWYAMPASQAAVGYPGPPVQWKLAEGAA